MRVRPDWPHDTWHWRTTPSKHETVWLLQMGEQVHFKSILYLQHWWADELLIAIACVHLQNTTEDLNGYFWGGADIETRPELQNNVRFFLELTVVQSDEKYSLNHMIDVKLLTELLSWAEGPTDLCHRVIIVINTVWYRVLWLWLAISRVLHYNTKYIVMKTYKVKKTMMFLFSTDMNSTHVAEQTVVVFSEPMQTAEHQPRS